MRATAQCCVGAARRPLSVKEEIIMSTKRVTKVALAERVRSLIAGTQKHPPSGQVTLGGQPFTTTALVQVLQDLGNALSAVDSAKASWQDAMKSLDDVKAKVDPTV